MLPSGGTPSQPSGGVRYRLSEGSEEASGYPPGEVNIVSPRGPRRPHGVDFMPSGGYGYPFF
jgi:hypothetical protein